MKAFALVLLFLAIPMPSFGAAHARYDFIAGEKIAQALQKILNIYKPQSMLDNPIIDKIKAAMQDANEGKVALAKSKIRLILKEYAFRLENHSQNNLPSFADMLTKAASGQEPY